MKTLTEALSVLKIPFELAPLQVVDIEYLSQFDRVGLFWDVGVGKTLAATVLSKMYDKQQNLILMPPILLAQWAAWLREVDPTATVEVYHGTGRKPEQLNADWVLTSHAIFRNDIAKISAHFSKCTFTMTVDEAQALKNVKSKLYQYVKSLSAGNNLILPTGTPTSGPEDAFSYISLKNPELYRSKKHFMDLHVEEEDFFGNVTAWREVDLIKDRLAMQATKRTKEEVFGDMINPPIYIPMQYDLSPAHMKLYDKLIDECLLDLVSSGQKIDASTPTRLYHAVQQMIINYDFFSDNAENRSATFDVIDSVIDQTGCMSQENSKLMVWTWYIRSSERVHRYLNENYNKDGSYWALAYGKSDSAKAVRQFLEDPKCRGVVAQPGSVGVGLNAMTVCHESLFVEFTRTPMVIKQAIGRVDRMGQKFFPNIRFAMANNTVQDKVMAGLLANDDLVTRIEGGEKSLRDFLHGVA